MKYVVGDKVGGYELVRSLGEGNMGAVFLGKKSSSDAEFALKIAYGKESDVVVAALCNEAALLRSLKNGKYPECYGFFREKEYACLLMEYIPGRNLEEVLLEEELSDEERLQLAVELTDLVWQLHSHRPPIIYRDLKPANIIKEPSGQLRLIDFGTAIFWEESVMESVADRGVGTYGYASPEQRMGKQVDVRSDVYALGACISYLMSGVNPGLPPFQIDPLENQKELSKIIQRAVSNDMKDRYANAGDLLIDLNKLKKQETNKNGFKLFLGKKNGKSMNQFIKNRQWNILRSDKKFLGLW